MTDESKPEFESVLDEARAEARESIGEQMNRWHGWAGRFVVPAAGALTILLVMMFTASMWFGRLGGFVLGVLWFITLLAYGRTAHQRGWNYGAARARRICDERRTAELGHMLRQLDRPGEGGGLNA